MSMLVLGGVAGPRHVSPLVASPASSVRGHGRAGCRAGTGAIAAAGDPMSSTARAGPAQEARGPQGEADTLSAGWPSGAS